MRFMFGDDNAPADTPRTQAIGVVSWAVIGWVFYLSIGAWDHDAIAEATALQARLASLPAQVLLVLAGH